MRPTDEHKIEKMIEKANFTLQQERIEQIKGAMFAAYEQKQSLPRAEKSIWSIIMKKPFLKLGIPAAVAVFFVALTLFNQSVDKVWAIEQTIEAMDQLQTLQITGIDYWGSQEVPFSFSLCFHEEDDLFDMRFESGKQIVVVRGKQAWVYWADKNVIKVYEDVTDSEGMMRDLRFWYKIAELNPWITGKVFVVLKAFADEWQEQYPPEGDPSRQVTVTCSYEPLNTSFQFVCDLETKLIVEGKYWRNTNRQGIPAFSAQSFIYNEEIPEEVFNFEIPAGAQIVHREQADQTQQRFAEGEKLFEQKKYAQAITVFQEIAEDPSNDPHRIEESLMMMGICYDHLGDQERAIEVFEKAVTEYEIKGWSEATYFYLGCSYLETGQRDKARRAFQNSLILGESARDPDAFPLKAAREALEKLDGAD